METLTHEPAKEADTRSLTILNERGDTTLTWEAEHDAEMETLI